MSRRSGQNGYIEQKWSGYYVRFWQDVPGQSKRVHKSIPICPLTGPGSLTESARKRRAREIITASGADTEAYFNQVQAINLGITFRQQAECWLLRVQTRKRKPVKAATASNWRHCLDKWLLPQLGDLPLSQVDNMAARELVAQLASAKLGAKTISNYFQVVKMVVASALNEQGNELYPRKWNHDFIDLPVVRDQRRPAFTADEVQAIVSAAAGYYRVLYALLGGTGLRIGEALAVEVTHLVDDCRVLQVRQSVWHGHVQSPKTPSAIRDIDLPEPLAAKLREFIGSRTDGFLFPTKSPSDILRRNLHPILTAMGKETCGFHSFRRFRTTLLRKHGVPEDLLRGWLGHANQSVTDSYSRLTDDLDFRREVCSRVGLGFTLPEENQAQNLDVVPSCTQEGAGRVPVAIH